MNDDPPDGTEAADRSPPSSKAGDGAGAPSRKRTPEMRGIWSAQTHRERMVDDHLVMDGSGKSVFRNEKLDAAGYRLAMGREVYVSPEKTATKSSVRKLAEEETFIVPAGQFAFLLTEEIVRIPDDAFAFIALRSKKTKFRGLVNVSGFHADPGYHGRLVFAVFNAGPADVHLRQGDELFTIMLADLDRQTDRPKPKGGGYLSIETDLITPLAGEVQSLAGLNEKITEVREDLIERLHSMERDVAVMRWSVALLLGGIVTMLVRTWAGG